MWNKCLSLICVFAYYETNGIYMADSSVKREYWLMFYHSTTELMSSYGLPNINSLLVLHCNVMTHNVNMYAHFVSSLHIETAEVVDFLHRPRGKHGLPVAGVQVYREFLFWQRPSSSMNCPVHLSVRLSVHPSICHTFFHNVPLIASSWNV